MPNFDINDPKRGTRTQWYTRDSSLRNTPNPNTPQLQPSKQPSNIPDFKEPPKNPQNPKTLQFANTPRPVVDLKPKGLNLKPPPVIGKVLGEAWRRGGGIVLPATSPLAAAPILLGGFLGGTEIGSSIYESASTPNSPVVKVFDAIQGIRNPWLDDAGSQVRSAQGEVQPQIVTPEVPANFVGGQTSAQYEVIVTGWYTGQYNEQNTLLGQQWGRIDPPFVGGPIRSIEIIKEWDSWRLMWRVRIVHGSNGMWTTTRSIAGVFGNPDLTVGGNGTASWIDNYTGQAPAITLVKNVNLVRIRRADGTSTQTDINQGGNPPPQQPAQTIQSQILGPPRIQIDYDFKFSGGWATFSPPSPTAKAAPSLGPTIYTPSVPSATEASDSTDGEGQESDTKTSWTHSPDTRPNVIPYSRWIPSPGTDTNTNTNPDPNPNPNPTPTPKPTTTPNPTTSATPTSSPSPSSSPATNPSPTTTSPSPNSVTKPEKTTTETQTTTTNPIPDFLPYTPPILTDQPSTKPKEDPQKVGYTPTTDDGGCCVPLGLGQQQIQQKQNTVLDKVDALGQLLDLDLLYKIDGTTTRTETKVDTVNTKLGNQMPNGGISGFLTRAFQATRIDKALNAINTVLILHNALILSQNIGQTLGIALSQGLSAIGIKDENGDPLDINATIGNSVTNFLKSIVGNELWNAANEQFKKLNAVYTASVNVLDNVTNMMDTLANGMEVIGRYNAKIGNALKRGGQVLDNAYEWMDDNINIHFGRLGKLEKVIEGLNTVQDISSDFEEVTSNVVEFQETLSQLEQSKQEFKDTLKDNEDAKKEDEETQKEESKPPTIEDSDLVKPPDD